MHKTLIFLILLQIIGTTKIYSQDSDYLSSGTISSNQIFFLGESHGVSENVDLAKQFITELVEKGDLKYIIAEKSFSSCLILNDAIQREDTAKIEEVLLNWGNTYSRTHEQYELMKHIIIMNKGRKDKIMLLGIDIPASARHLCDTVLMNYDDAFIQDYVKNNIEQAKAAIAVNNRKWDKTRDQFIYQNFKRLREYYGITDEKMFGLWGITHTYKTSSEGAKWIAAFLQEENYRVYSIGIYYLNSSILRPWYWVKKNKRDGSCFYINRYSNVSKKARKRINNLENLDIVQISDLDRFKVKSFIDSPTSKEHLTDYLDEIIIIKNGNAMKVLGSNNCK